MKNKDLFVIGGIGVLAYMLVSKPKLAEAKPAGVSVIAMPTAIPEALDIGGIFSGLAGIISGVTPQVIPEINIPEFKFPDISAFIPEMPDWEGLIPDWESFIPDWAELTPDWDKLLDPFGLFDGNGGNGKNGNGEKGLIDRTKDLIVRNIISPVTEATGEAVAEPISAIGTGVTGIVDYLLHPFSLEYGILAPLFKGKDIDESLIGIGVVTPEQYYKYKGQTRGLLPQDILAAKETATGTPESAALPYQEYEGKLPTYLQRKIWEQR